MERLGNKVEARALAERAGVPVMPATGALPHDPAEARRLAEEVGFPLMVKASWGGGGRGMRMVHDPGELDEAVEAGRREARAAFGNDEVFLERLVERAWHIEVQILADQHGGVVHLFERDCTVQRRHQKVIEIAPSPRLDPGIRDADLRRGRAPRARGPLPVRGDGRVPARRRQRRVLLHRGQPARPGRAHRHRGRHGDRHRQGADPPRPRARPSAPPRAACRSRRTCASTARRCSAASPPRTPRTTSSPTTGASAPTARPPASASAWTAAPPTPRPSSRRSTTPCWRR